VVARRYPETVNKRYLAAPIAASLNVLGTLAGIAGLIGIAAQAPGVVQALTLGLVIPVIYLCGITAVAWVLARELPLLVRARVPLVLAAMHMTWGLGFLTSPRRLAAPKGAQ